MLINSSRYGLGTNATYDPRFPGYFSADFEIKGQLKHLDNLRKSDIIDIIELKHNLKCISSSEPFEVDKEYNVLKHTSLRYKVIEYKSNGITLFIDDFINVFGEDKYFTKFRYI